MHDKDASTPDIAARMRDDTLRAALRRQPPINLARAYAVMQEMQLQGIVVGDPLNVFHFTGYWPQIAHTKAGHPPTTFALLTHDPDDPRGFVTSHFSYYYTFCDAGFSQPFATYLFADAGDDGVDRRRPAPVRCWASPTAGSPR